MKVRPGFERFTHAHLSVIMYEHWTAARYTRAYTDSAVTTTACLKSRSGRHGRHALSTAELSRTVDSMANYHAQHLLLCARRPSPFRVRWDAAVEVAAVMMASVRAMLVSLVAGAKMRTAQMGARLLPTARATLAVGSARVRLGTLDRTATHVPQATKRAPGRTQ